MIDIAVQDLNKYYGSNHILKSISFDVIRGEKIGLIGKNGSGKTTLFKVLSGMEEHESGTVMRASGAKIEVLEQIPFFNEEFTVEDVLHIPFEELFNLSEEMRKLETGIQNVSSDEETTLDKLLKTYGRLQTQYEAMGGYDFESRIDKVCNGMKIGTAMRSMLFSELSGGEQTRVNLARILLEEADILLLDEPTNHLDLDSVQWIEGFLKDYDGTVVTISHDRSFLDQVVTRIIEIDDGGLTFYEGNYSYYAVEKERRFEQQSEQYQQQQKKISQLESAAKRMHEWARNADNPAMHKRAFSIEKRIERMDRIDKPRDAKRITAEFKENGFSSADMVLFKEITKAYGSRTLFCDVDLDISRNDRIALLGENGCGKSTLIKLLTGDETADQGEVRIGNSVKMAYLPQVIEFEDGEASVLDIIRYTLETSEENARRILAPFHFKGRDVLKKAAALSGGEKSRLMLCILMQKDINLLVMDEPTNHLDIPSREWIEEAVSSYDGTLLFISHDRYFINKFASRVWEMKDGSITDYAGTYREFCDWKQNTAQSRSARSKDRNPSGDNNPSRKQKDKDATLENGNPQTRQDLTRKECEAVEDEIVQTEDRIKAVCKEMEACESDYDKLNSLYLEKLELEKHLEQLYNRWSRLSR